MTVTEKITSKSGRTIQLNDVPEDTAFRGIVQYEDGTKRGPGIWIKVSHGNTDMLHSNGGFVVIGLTVLTSSGHLFPITPRCLQVTEYVPISQMEIVVVE